MGKGPGLQSKNSVSVQAVVSTLTSKILRQRARELSRMAAQKWRPSASEASKVAPKMRVSVFEKSPG
jgi:hypothetical protein